MTEIQEGYRLPEKVAERLTREHLTELQTVCIHNLATSTTGVSESQLSMAARLQVPPAAHYTACVLTAETMEDALTQQMVLLQLKDVSDKQYSLLGMKVFSYIESNIRVVCVLAGTGLDLHEVAAQATKEICRKLMPLKIFYGIGNTVVGLDKVHHTVQSSLADLDKHKESAYAEGVLESSAMYYRDRETIQTILLQKIRDNDYEGVETAIREHTGFLRKNINNEFTGMERFLVRYLQSITNECLRVGITLERFESYVPTVVCMLQRDNDGCIEQLLKLTEQIMKYMSVHRTSESNHLLNMAKDYMHEHINNETLNLEAVSDHVGLSRVYFCKLFHQMEGVSFNTYLTRIRMEKAKQLLLTTNMKVYEVSNAVGFSHAKYFSNVFKKYVGQTPIEFQRCAHE